LRLCIEFAEPVNLSWITCDIFKKGLVCI